MATLPRRLNLGCGRDRRADCLNVDQVAAVEPDLVWNLDQYPYPLPEGHFEHIYLLDVIEHLESLPAFFKEALRLLAPGGVLEITTPHYSSANSFTDPTHRHHLGYFFADYFTDASKWSFYSPVRFAVLERRLVFHPGRLARWIARWANHHPAAYERRWAWLYPAWFLHLRLAAVKGGGEE